MELSVWQPNPDQRQRLSPRPGWSVTGGLITWGEASASTAVGAEQ